MRRTDHGETFVDLLEAQGILGKSRRTIYYLIDQGGLSAVKLTGSNKTWVALNGVMELTTIGKAVNGLRPEVQQHLRRFHPQLFLHDI